MLALNTQELETVEKSQALVAESDEIQQQLRHIGYPTTAELREEKERLDARMAEIRKESRDLSESRGGISIGIKRKLDEAVKSNIPGGDVEAIFGVAQELVQAILTDPATATGAHLVKSIVIQGLDAFNDPDIHAARARGIFTRYTALKDAGLPESLVHGILLAEASRNIPLPNMSRSKK